MFKISPVHDEQTAESCIKSCGIEKADGAFLYAMHDVDSGELMGLCQFDIGEVGYIYDLCPTENFSADFEAMFILGRQTMNFINTCGVRFCKARVDKNHEKLIKAIGFKEVDGEFACDMEGMFDGSHCSEHSK